MIKDSGERREFNTGAVRDIQEGKGRCDLLPLGVASTMLSRDDVLWNLEMYHSTNKTDYLHQALRYFCLVQFDGSMETMLLEVSKHFEEGAKKYGENNWQKGLPPSCYIDSAIRHYLKFRRGDNDEPHHLAFVWNLMCCCWEVDYHDKDN